MYFAFDLCSFFWQNIYSVEKKRLANPVKLCVRKSYPFFHPVQEYAAVHHVKYKPEIEFEKKKKEVELFHCLFICELHESSSLSVVMSTS